MVFKKGEYLGFGFKKGNQLGKNNRGKKRGDSWNKGLTKETDDRVMKSSIKISNTEKEQYKSGKRKSARGFLGKTHSDS